MTELKLKMSEVLESNAACDELLKLKMPINVSVGILGLQDSFESKVLLAQKTIKKLMDENCEKNENGYVPVDPTKPELGYKLVKPAEYHKGFQELMDSEVPILFDPIELGNLEPEGTIIKILRKFLK